MASKMILPTRYFKSLNKHNVLSYMFNSKKLSSVKSINVCLKQMTASTRMYCSVTHPFKCGNCMKEFQAFSFKCPHCNALQLVSKNVNFFQVLEQKINFDLDNNILKKKYLQLQSEFHPDKFSISNENDKAISADIAATVNKAYSTLANPYERGKYVLQMYSISVEDNTLPLDPKFLNLIMILNEELEDIKTLSDLERFEEGNEKEIKNLTELVSCAFSKKDYEVAKTELQKMKYYISMRERLKAMKTSFN
ncbi:co-chaperone protein HscB homolog [Halyomorpha halys]|uniref:co-chaperone protein HscB homolog n=1 Tax=Halyomorpha halys TaxID=286706 RepID=UPI0006D4E076|nr:uncharacterized protein LOC106679036 [Halyomorpha halys]